MSTAFSEIRPTQVPAVARLRVHAALLRALLDELDRFAPVSSPGGSREARVTYLTEHIAEELARLSCRMLECAAAMADSSSTALAGHGAGE
jgi:hypothetical protein